MASNRNTFEILKGFGAAGTAACIAEMCTIPIDTAKVRLQVQAGATTNPYTSMTNCVSRIAKEEGPAALFNGLAPGLMRQMVFASLRIGLYTPIRDLFSGSNSPDDASLIIKIAAGLSTGTIGIAVANPVDLVKIRLQAESRRASGGPPRYSGMMDACAKILKADGITGFWKGVAPNIARNSVINASELASYDQFKQLALNSGRFSDNVGTHIMCGLGAGLVATVIGSPVDVVKTRVMNAAAGEYNGTMHCFVKTFKREGPLAFYKGFSPNFARIGSWNVIMFLSFEQIKAAIFDRD